MGTGATGVTWGSDRPRGVPRPEVTLPDAPAVRTRILPTPSSRTTSPQYESDERSLTDVELFNMQLENALMMKSLGYVADFGDDTITYTEQQTPTTSEYGAYGTEEDKYIYEADWLLAQQYQAQDSYTQGYDSTSRRTNYGGPRYAGSYDRAPSYNHGYGGYQRPERGYGYQYQQPWQGSGYQGGGYQRQYPYYGQSYNNRYYSGYGQRYPNYGQRVYQDNYYNRRQYTGQGDGRYANGYNTRRSSGGTRGW